MISAAAMTSNAASDIASSAGPITLQERAKALVESGLFEKVIIAVIVINAIGLGLETSPSVMSKIGGLVHMLDKIALAIFVVELGIKFFAYRFAFFKNGWNIFDLVIVSVALIPASQQFSVLRALRILRALRLVSVVPSMRKVITGLFAAIPSIGTVIVMLLLLFYISAVMATKLFGEAFPEWFGSLGASLYSLFQIMTLESWSMGIVRPVMAEFPYAWGFFIPFILLTSFIVLNLFIGVIVNAMSEAADEEAHNDREEILTRLSAMQDQLTQLREAAEKDR